MILKFSETAAKCLSSKYCMLKWNWKCDDVHTTMSNDKRGKILCTILPPLRMGLSEFVFDKTVTCKFNVCWLQLRHRFLSVSARMQMHATGHVVVEIYSRALCRCLLLTLNRQLNSIKLASNVFICICWIKMHSDEVAESANTGLQSAWWILLIQITIWVFPHRCLYLGLQTFLLRSECF